MWISSSISRVILLLDVISFKMCPPCGREEINHALCFVVKQTLCLNSYGLQATLIKRLKAVPAEGLRLKLSSVNIPRRWRNGALVLLGDIGRIPQKSEVLIFF